MSLASSVLLASIPLLVTLYTDRFREEDKLKAFPNDPEDLNLPVEQIYDFIVVGAGASGSILARRLSDAGFSTLLLEAGGNPPPIYYVPGVSVPRNNATTFRFTTIPQKIKGRKPSGRFSVPVGKMMGGSTIIGGQAYVRGSPGAYDEWAKVTGDPSWLYENIKKYFRRVENYMTNSEESDQKPSNGMVSISSISFAPGRTLFFKAGEKLGYEVKDYNEPLSVGFSPRVFPRKEGRKDTAYTAYIRPIEETQEKLEVQRYSIVSQILIDGEEKRATGVLYQRHGVPRVAKASKEVILSAGALLSPMILINSGIGPKEEVAKAKDVELIMERPVGQVFLNHPTLPLPVGVNDPSLISTLERNLTFTDFSRFLNKGLGPLAGGSAVADAFLSSAREIFQQKFKSENDNDNDLMNWPDVRLEYKYNNGSSGLAMGSESESESESASASMRQNTVQILVLLNRPRSYGSVTFNASNYLEGDLPRPVIDLNYFSDEEDLNVLAKGAQLVQKLLQTPPFKNVGARLKLIARRKCRQYRFGSLDFWKCYTQNSYGSAEDYSGTCRMGERNDPGAVVDSELRVIGIRGLRVIDASIIPVLPNAGILAATYMIAEKSSQQIIDQYSNSKL